MMTVLAMALLTVSDNGLHLFVTFPLIWIMLETFIRGLLATVAAATAMVLVVIWSEGGVNGDVLGSALAMGFGVAAFSIGLAAWIWRVEVRSHERRELVARLSETVSELEAARAELASKERSQGAADERARIAADIHDTLAQSFSSIAILAQAARQNDSVRPGLIEQIEVAARDGLAEARGLLARSRPPMDLALAVKRLARDLSERTRIRASVDSARWQPAATRLEVVLLRVAQEALRNVERHSHAGEARVILKVDDVDDVAVLEVHDDGEGFDADLPSPGYGLHGTRSRLEIEGGSLGVAASRGHGTTLTARLPFQAAEGTGA